ncbi:MAG: TMEM165/GDT1 family protein [bacterium]
MSIVIPCFLLVFLSEMGDKTQFLALLLSARTRRPSAVLAGVWVGAVLSLGLAAFLGGLLATCLKASVLKWMIGIGFLVFAVWTLIPERSEEIEPKGFGGTFTTTVVMIFLAEIGDKAQAAVMVLGAHYHKLALVTLGSSLGMLAADALAVALGERITGWLPLRWIRRGACLLFLGLGIAVLLKR